MKICLSCEIELSSYQAKYCSNLCQKQYEYEKYIERWLNGDEAGGRGINAKNMSRHVIKYLSIEFGSKCTRCSWSEVHPQTGRVPLEIDHIDGDAENNSKENLRLLCPNCHSLTSNYRNLNKGNGRLWRRKKYVKIDEVPL